MKGHWIALTEMIAVLGFGLGWAVLELVGLRLDKKKREREAAAADASTEAGPKA